MNPLIIVVMLIGATVVSPIVSLKIPAVRDMILVVVPDKVVLEFADKIDKSRKENIIMLEEVNTENEKRITELEQKISEYETRLANLSTQTETIVKESDISLQQLASNQKACNEAQMLYSTTPERKKGQCGTVGPTNIVDMYKSMKGRYKDMKENREDSDTGMYECTKKYFELTEEQYNKYQAAKALCK